MQLLSGVAEELGVYFGKWNGIDFVAAQSELPLYAIGVHMPDCRLSD
jgi:hypothetical protein